MHPAIVKARRVGSVAHEHNWKGALESEIQENDIRVTTITGSRDDEGFQMQWANEKLSSATYFIYVGDECHQQSFTHSKALLAKLSQYPDIEDLFKWFPNANRPSLVEQYRRLPFDWRNDDNEEIISKLLGCKITWYGHEQARQFTDVVLPKKNKQIRIQDVGHRKLFHFIGAQAGFRSVLLDTILKVA